MKRVLVTGGAGFLGTHVVEALSQHPAVDAVVSADLRLPKTPRPDIIDVVCDVTDPDGIAPLLREHTIDTVVHLAAIVNPGRNTALEYRVDVEGSRNVIDACIAAGVTRLVVSSSGAAYGYHADNPDWIREDWPTRGSPEFAYSRHKSLVEELLRTARDDHPELEQVVFRIGTILRPDVKNQITSLWDGDRILAISGSESPFVFVWADDVAEAMVRAATTAPAGIYNVAGSGALTVTDIGLRLGKPLRRVPAWALQSALWVGHALRLTVHGPQQVGFLRYRPVLDNAALINDFGFTPSHTSAEAFEHYLQTHPEVINSDAF